MYVSVYRNRTFRLAGLPSSWTAETTIKCKSCVTTYKPEGFIDRKEETADQRAGQ